MSSLEVASSTPVSCLFDMSTNKPHFFPTPNKLIPKKKTKKTDFAEAINTENTERSRDVVRSSGELTARADRHLLPQALVSIHDPAVCTPFELFVAPKKGVGLHIARSDIQFSQSRFVNLVCYKQLRPIMIAFTKL